MVHPPVPFPHIAWLVNLRTLTVDGKPSAFNSEVHYWDRFLKLLNLIPSQHLCRATYVTSTPSNTVPAGNADKDWEHVETIVTQREWAEGEPGTAKVFLQLCPRTDDEVRSADRLIRGLREQSRRLFIDGWMDVSIT
jgi:hypothetical protein